MDVSPASGTPLLPGSQTRRRKKPSVLLTAAPLLLAIAGSALTPLPCAFSLAGVGGGTALLVAIAAANDYTTVLMVRSASRLGGTGYEEVMLAAGGRRALLWCRVALVLLLFGTMCGCLAAIQETGMRAVEALHSHALAHALDPWLLVGTTAIVLLPLSLASLGDLPFVALLGVMMEICLAVYVLALAVHQAIHEANAHGHGSASVGGASYAPDASSYDSYTYGDAANALSAREHADSARALSAHGGGHARLSTPTSALGIPEAAATFGYAFYVQPCAVPLLRTLPPGDEGARVLCAAVHLTFVLTALAYLCVGLGGLLYFGEGHVPQDLLQGFGGRIGGSLAAFFAVYLMLAFSPIVVPLRETLVRIYHEHTAAARRDRDARAAAHAACASSMARNNADACGGGHATVPAPLSAEATLPPLQNALLTTGLIGCALAVALAIPNASSTLFALTGATGVCAIGYVFPIYAYWRLPPEYGGVAAPTTVLSSRVGEAYNPLVTPPPAPTGRPDWLTALTASPFFGGSRRASTEPPPASAHHTRGGLTAAALSTDTSSRPTCAAHAEAADAPSRAPPAAHGDDENAARTWLHNVLVARVWPASVLGLGSLVSVLTLLAVFTQLVDGAQSCGAS